MLNEIACRRAAAKEKAYKLADEKGLHLFVTPTGFKSWRWKYRYAGKEKRIVFGPYPDVTLAEARELRAEAARLLRMGMDPGVERLKRKAAQNARAGATFEIVGRAWHASQAATWSKPYGKLVLRSLENDVFPLLGPLPVTEITTPLVLEVLRPIEARGALETAHRVRQRISEVFERAIASGIAERDPAAIAHGALPKPKKGRFPAVTSLEAARAVLTTAEKQPAQPLTKLASRFLALTAVRSAVLRHAEPGEFEDLDGAAPLWRIPAEKMKLLQELKEDDGFEFVVPLSRQAVATIKVAMQLAAGGPLIFRSIRHARRPLSDSTVSKLYREAGYSGIHVPHGWRATFSTIMNGLAEQEDRVGDRAIIDLMLAHAPGSRGNRTEAVYNRSAYMKRRREIAQEWADLLVTGLAGPEDLLKGPRQHA